MSVPGISHMEKIIYGVYLVCSWTKIIILNVYTVEVWRPRKLLKYLYVEQRKIFFKMQFTMLFCKPLPRASRFIICFKSQANVAQTNSLMCSYSSRSRTISFLLRARATSISRLSPFLVFTLAQDFNHLSALPTSFVATEMHM